MSFRPRLNSVMLLPSERATLGSRLPNNNTARPPITNSSTGLNPNMAITHRVSNQRRSSLFARGVVVAVFLDFLDPLFELDHAAPHRPHQTWQLIAEEQQDHQANYQNLPGMRSKKSKQETHLQ